MCLGVLSNIGHKKKRAGLSKRRAIKRPASTESNEAVSALISMLLEHRMVFLIERPLQGVGRSLVTFFRSWQLEVVADVRNDRGRIVE